MKVDIIQHHRAVVKEITTYELPDDVREQFIQAPNQEVFIMENHVEETGYEQEIVELGDTVYISIEYDAKTWRHKDGSIRVDHMDTRPGDYYG